MKTTLSESDRGSQGRAITVVSLPGDGIGPEVMAQGRAVLDQVTQSLGIRVAVQEIQCGGKFYLEHGTRDWPEGAEAACAAADLILLGAVGWPGKDGAPVTMADGKMAGYSPVIGNRTKLDLYANIRPVKLYAGVKQSIHGQPREIWDPAKVDMVIVRENTEGLYSGSGGILAPGGVEQVATDTRVITRRASERVIRKAFEIARARNGAPKDGKRRVTCILKDNVLRGCQMFGRIFREIGAEYPDIEQDTAIIDAYTQWLMTQPEMYDVCVTTNMFGDIVTDLASVLQGGMGMAVGCNVGDDHGMFEPIHGSAPRYAGKDWANPMAMILAVKEGLDWVGRRKEWPDLVTAAAGIEAAVQKILARGAPLTADLVGEAKGAGTRAVGAAVVAEIAEQNAAG